MSQVPLIPSSLDWCTLKDCGHHECKCASSCHCGCNNDYVFEVLLVKAVRIRGHKCFQVKEAERELCEAPKQLVTDLVQEEVEHGFREGREYVSSMFAKT